MNGRERLDGQIRPCLSMADLTVVVAGGIRLEILKSLLLASREVTSLADDLELEVSMVSHNLRILRDNGLVKAQRRKQKRIYHLTDRVRGSRNGEFVQLSIRSEQGEAVVFHLLTSDRRRHAK